MMVKNYLKLKRENRKHADYYARELAQLAIARIS